MTCPYVTSGCNVPESECIGTCMQGHTGAQVIQLHPKENLGHRVAFWLCIVILGGFFVMACVGGFK